MKRDKLNREEIENMLKFIWLREERGDRVDASELGEYLDILKEEGYIDIVNDRVYLTDSGRERAEKIVRLYRLAERLLVDILGIEDYGEHACKFEHVISEEVEEALCTLLGHPRYCPHGEYIPMGRCCITNGDRVERRIYRLSELQPDEEGEIKYVVATGEEGSIMFSIGLIPGKKVKVIRTYPNMVIEIDNAHIAIDRRIAELCYIVKTQPNL